MPAAFLVFLHLLVANTVFSCSSSKKVKDPNAPWLYELVFPEIDTELDVVSVVVTTYSGSSYDNLFRSVPQYVTGGRVRLFYVESSRIGDLKELMSDLPIKKRIQVEEIEEEDHENEVIVEDINDDDKKEEMDPESLTRSRSDSRPFLQNAIEPREFLDQILEIDPDCVLFNWECSSGYSDHGFSSPSTIDFVELLLRRGHITMFSDFAVKALISEWKEEKLGPNPFLYIGTHEYQLTINYDCSVLRGSGIPQLEAVGSLCSEEYGSSTIGAMGGTVVVGGDPEILNSENNPYYEAKVLTIASDLDGREPREVYRNEHLSQIGEFRGSISHAALTYRENYGELIISSGHWVSLMSIDSSYENLKTFSTNSYGAKYDSYFSEMDEMDEEEREIQMLRLNTEFVQQTPSVRNMKTKSSQYSYEENEE